MPSVKPGTNHVDLEDTEVTETSTFSEITLTDESDNEDIMPRAGKVSLFNCSVIDVMFWGTSVGRF